ncbi:MAG: LytTR family DNA-binding domain-containing protein [Cyclobacteriaceae bacterium]|nr:LytTR family DNA-binding domain-containing protein [Cyclobacteriaceae bacterium]
MNIEINVVIVEDENPAATRLQTVLKELRPAWKVLTVLDAVDAAVVWFSTHAHPDLCFFDIQLSDGISFEIFDVVPLHKPVIFTTAYDEYALKAFKVNSIDYLLKPVAKKDLESALDKFEKYASLGGWGDDQVNKITSVSDALRQTYKKRFLVKIGEHIHSIQTRDILYFYSLEKATFCTTTEGKNYLLDYPLDRIETLIDPENYKRINRKYVIHLDAFEDIIAYSNSRLRLKLKHSDDRDVIVARERVKEFKDWLDK